MLSQKQLFDTDIVHKTPNIESFTISAYDVGYSSINTKGNMEAYEMAIMYLKQEYNCVYFASIKINNPYYVIYGEGDRVIYGMKYENKKIYSWSYTKETKKMNETLKITLDYDVSDFYVYSKTIPGYENSDIMYYFKTGALTENKVGQSYENSINSLYFPTYYTPNFGVGYYNKYSFSSSSFLTLTFYPGFNKEEGSGIDFTLDPRPLCFIDQDGTSVQIATERCLKNPSVFDMTKRELSADDTRLITEANIKVKQNTLEEYQKHDWIDVEYVEEVEHKPTLLQKVKMKFKSFF